MLSVVAFSSQAFTSPSAHLASATRTTTVSMGVDSVPGVVGLAQSKWPSTREEKSLGGFSHTTFEASVMAAPPGPVDSVPGVVGLAQSKWPSTREEKSLGGFSHTSFEVGVMAAPPGPVDSVPSIIGLAQSNWPEISYTGSVRSTKSMGRAFDRVIYTEA